jgi:hypothetical protein
VFHATGGTGNWNDPSTWDQEVVPGVYKVSTRDYLVGDIDAYTFDGAGSVDEPYVDPEWQATIQGDSTQPITGLDDFAGRRNVAFTIQHQLDMGERVVHGYLALALRRALRGETTSDFVQLFDMAPEHRLAFADLGWSANVLPTGSFVGVVDMGGFLDQIQNGSVNVRVNDDTGVDWAMYVATVATPIASETGATVFIVGGSSVTIDSEIDPLEHLQVGGDGGGSLNLQGDAAISLNGEYRQLANGSLRIALSESTVPTAILTVGAQATLAGLLQVELADGYVPTVNDEFALLSAGSELQGEFDQIELPELGQALNWNLHVEDNTLLLSVVYDRIPGDFNLDGRVDTADYTIWRDTQGHTGEGLAADGSGPTPGVPDGMVDEHDYAIWKSNFGATAFDEGTGLGVPEPATAAILLLALLGTAFYRGEKM